MWPFKKKKKKYDSNQSFKLLILEDNCSTLHISLGITEERIKDISDLCIEYYMKNRNLSIALEGVIAEMNHINEVVAATLIIGRIHDQSDNSMLKALLEKLT